VSAVGERVGWVERSETHHLHASPYGRDGFHFVQPILRIITAALLFLHLTPAIAQTAARQTVAEPPVRIDIAVTPVDAFEARDPSKRRFGALEFRGGLVLSSPYKEFGGFSALRVAPDGSRFIAISDKGRWLRGRIVYDHARPVRIADAEMAPALGPDGRPLAARGWYDTESIAEDGGTLYVGIERVNRIVKFDYGRFGLAARAQIVPVPPGVGTLPNNKGLECLTVAGKATPLAGTLIAISERGLDANGNIKGFLIGGRTPGDFSYKRVDEFDVSDCATLPSGDILVLERKFRWSTGVQIRIRRIAAASIVPGALVEGPALLDADMGFQIDNMEGLSVHTLPTGEIVLTLISDDNFSILQRTLLLQFTLVGE